MATLNDALNFARAKAQADSNGLTDANGIIFANAALLDFHRKLIANGVDASAIQEAYCDATVPTSGNGSTFLYPSDCLFLKAIEVNFTDTEPGNYVRAEQVDVSNPPSNNSFSYLRKNCSSLHPKFDDRGDWYEIFPAFQSGDNLTQAIRLMYFKKPTEYSATSDTIAYPESLDYRILGLKIAADYLESLKGDSLLVSDKVNLAYEKAVQALINTLARGSQQPTQSTVVGWTGWEF